MAENFKTFSDAGAGGSSSDAVMGTSTEANFSTLTDAMQQEASLEVGDVILKQQDQRENASPQGDGDQKTAPFDHNASMLKATAEMESMRLGPQQRPRTKAKFITFIKDDMIGVNFHKPSGKWMAHIWLSSSKNVFLGCYFTMTEAGRAYDKASLKLFSNYARLNFYRQEYVNDVKEMAECTNFGYLQLLQRQATRSKLVHVDEGIRTCPDGWYEVRRRDFTSPGKLWTFLGRFRSLQDAKRCFEGLDRE